MTPDIPECHEAFKSPALRLFLRLPCHASRGGRTAQKGARWLTNPDFMG
jgi:hypothetical protein